MRSDYCHKGNTGPMLIDFPAETLDNVMSHLWDDFRTLKQTSLVSRSWSSVARPHIFRSIPLDETDRVEALKNMVAETPVIAFWIHELRICDSVDSGHYWPYGFWHLWTSPDNLRFMKSLKNLKTLTFLELNFWGASDRIPEAEEAVLAQSLAMMTTVTEVVWDDCTLFPQLMAPFVRCLPALASLSFNTVMVESVDPDDTFRPSYGKSPRLRELSVDADPPQPNMSIGDTAVRFLSSQSLQTVQSLRIAIALDDWDCHATLESFLKLTWDSLRTLRIEISCNAGYDWDGSDRRYRRLFKEWDPARMAGLRRVQVGCTSKSQHIWRANILILLCKMEVLPIEDISLQASFDFLGDFKPETFRRLNEAIAKTGFSILKSLRFLYHGRLTPKKARERVHRKCHRETKWQAEPVVREVTD
ncbi:hypothetical protein EIP91_005698 [Steccherinum ochraceum]|uniref:F-box domain-containing protein n=1 Tax=Steccherinum ochraceum TaxID=92696 RepID=A0A4R0R9E1_9APHY|nr:hypothetical protein EIP91_005698 [Steccherinum ochraceum]